MTGLTNSKVNFRDKSEKLFEKAQKVMPGGVSSPVRAFKKMKMSPLVVQRGYGDQLFDIDGNAYLDFCLGYGALLVGHAPLSVVQAVQKQLSLGSCFGALTAVEQKLAAKIIQAHTSLDQVRFTCSGTEATSAALRLARAVTGKQKVVKFAGNYHGSCDAFLVNAGSAVGQLHSSFSAGVLQSTIDQTIVLEYNDIEGLSCLKERHQEIAAVIVEPIAGNMGVIQAQKSFLEQCQRLCQQYGIVLIFDEVITGFRFGFSSFAELDDFQPDLVCFGKIIGGGFNCGAFAGKKELMSHISPEGNVFHAGTFTAHPVTMTAGYEVLRILEKDGVYEELQRKADLLCEPIEQVIESMDLNVTLNRYGSMFSLFFGCREVNHYQSALSSDHQTFTAFYHYLFEKGVLLAPSPLEAQFISLMHTDEHLLYSSEVIVDFLKKRV